MPSLLVVIVLFGGGLFFALAGSLGFFAPVGESRFTLDNFQHFLDWIDETLEPEAERLQIHPCLVCTHKLETLPTFREARNGKNNL